MPLSPIKLVLFDALHTIITPRLPIHVQYSQVLEPFLGQLDPSLLKAGFKKALKDVQREKPVYVGGADGWWKDVIRRTALAAGGDPQMLDKSLPLIVPRLMHRFSSREGYKAFDDTLPTLKSLKGKDLKTGVVTNADNRIQSVITDLGLSTYLDFVIISEVEGIEKPDQRIWERACSYVNVHPSEACHIGDELVCDYYGAKHSGLRSFLLRRPGPEGEGERKEQDENLSKVETIESLDELLRKV